MELRHSGTGDVTPVVDWQCGFREKTVSFVIPPGPSSVEAGCHGSIHTCLRKASALLFRARALRIIFCTAKGHRVALVSCQSPLPFTDLAHSLELSRLLIGITVCIPGFRFAVFDCALLLSV